MTTRDRGERRTPSRTSKRKRRAPEQLTLDIERKPDGKHGGWRPGSGRLKRVTGVAHSQRPSFAGRYPVLVTWRLVADLPSLRHWQYADIIVAAIAAVHRVDFRITDYSIQRNHLHLICEADGADALSDGMQSLASRIAGRINRAMGRRGALFADRYHDRVLTTPREVKNALRYVINNARHHAEAVHYYHHPDWIDPFSSGWWFDGWRQPIGDDERIGSAVRDAHGDLGLALDSVCGRRATAEPHTWLRRIGWRRWGLLERDEVPGELPHEQDG